MTLKILLWWQPDCLFLLFACDCVSPWCFGLPVCVSCFPPACALPPSLSLSLPLSLPPSLSPSAPEPSQRAAPAPRQPPPLPATPASDQPHLRQHFYPGSPVDPCLIVVAPYPVNSPPSSAPSAGLATLPSPLGPLPWRPPVPPCFLGPQCPRLPCLSLLGSPCPCFPGVRLFLTSTPSTPFPLQ